MNRIVAAALLVTFALTPVASTRAQSARGLEKRSTRADIAHAKFASAEALTDRRGALVRWEVSSEQDVIGYNVYNIDAFGARQVNKSMVLGSAVRAGGDPKVGESYRLYDPLGARGDSYIIETFSRDGSRSFGKQLNSKFVRDIEQSTGTRIDNLKEAALSTNHNVEAAAMVLPEELQVSVASSQQAADAETQKWVAAQPGARITVRRDGMYRVTRAMLQFADFPVNSDPANWRLFMEGVEHPIIVGPGGDYIEFFGRAIDTPESEFRVYYLIADTVPGRRIPSRALRSFGGTILSTNFPMEAVKKERIEYWNKLLNGDGENYFGRIITSGLPLPIPFTLAGIDTTSENSVITVKMQGFSPTSHEVRVVVNGHDLGLVHGPQQASYQKEITVPTSYLVEGTNNLEISSTRTSDFSFFDSVTVDYARRYRADQDRISFFTPGFRRVNVEGFGSANVRIFDITQDGQPHLVSNVQVEQNGGTYTAKLPSARPAVYYAATDAALLSPSGVVANSPSTLSTPANGADLIIISHTAADFMAASEAWADYRREQGFTVKVVDVRDVFDEFSYGVLSSKAVRDFLQYAAGNWQTPPRYVLLMGDTTDDPRNYRGFGYFALVPTKTVDTQFGETGSDDALVDFNNDGFAEIPIGRIPARVASSITTAFNKTKIFETPAMQSLDRGALFAYDEPRFYDFKRMSESLRTRLPESMPVTYVDKQEAGSGDTLVNTINTGKYIVNYTGHGSTGVWSSNSFFGIGVPGSNDHVARLTNAASPSIFTMLTCLNGYFLLPDKDAIGERLLHASNGGAVVTWSSTGETTPDMQELMANRFYEQLTLGNITRIGDLIRDSKQFVVGGIDVRYSWVLLGDPMLKVR